MNEQEIILEDFNINPISSAEMIKTEEPPIDETVEETTLKTESQILIDTDVIKEEAELSPIFKELAEPKLPQLPKEDRAWLQIQSPNKAFLYWSMKNNPFQTLSRIFGGQTGSYRLVIKLINLNGETEEIYPVETEGDWWFDVDANTNYQAEIGFYAPNRPFIRILKSNAIETPRKSPSPRTDFTPYFAVSAKEFAEVLDRSGYKQDAWEVALVGDDWEFAQTATQKAFTQLTGKTDFVSADDSDMRFALLALAARTSLDELRGHIAKSLFEALQANAEKLSAEKALAALQENFGVSDEIIEEEEILAPTVFGASLINFPRVSRKRRIAPRKFVPKLAPVSSFRPKV